MPEYVIITPVKNEMHHLPEIINSVVNQEKQPRLWVIVDGNSDDGSFEMLQAYTKKYPWIHPLKQRAQGRTSHESVSIAVFEAYDYVERYCYAYKLKYDYIWTTDGDQLIGRNVCGGVIAKCNEDPTIGAASGSIYNPDGTKDTYPNGELPNKRVYPRKAIDKIGGFPITKYSYDTVLLAKLRIAGYNIVTFDKYMITNLRTDSGIERDMWKSHVTFGRARWYLGYSIPLVIAGSGYLIMKGQFKKAVGIFYGYLVDRIHNEEQIEDEDIKRHFGKDRLKEVLGLKK